MNRLVSISLAMIWLSAVSDGTAHGQEQDVPAIAVTVLDDLGKPISNTAVRRNYIYRIEGQEAPGWDHGTSNTDDEGQISMELPGIPGSLQFHVVVEGFVHMYAQWKQEEFARDEVPEQLIFKLQKGVSIGGQVLDAADNPVVGANIDVRFELDEQTAGPARVSGSLTDEDFGPVTRTDAQGKWTLTNAPESSAEFFVIVKHAEFINIPPDGAYQRKSTDSTALRSQTAEFVLQKGIDVAGNVKDKNGDPITAGFIIVGKHPDVARIPAVFEIERDGTYRLPPQIAGELILTVVANGYAPKMQAFEIESMMESPDFELEPGYSVTIQVVDQGDKPIEGAMVVISRWQGERTLYNMPPRNPSLRDLGIPFQTDAGGMFHWGNAPGEAVQYQVAARGYEVVRSIELAPSDKTHVVKLKRPTTQSGSVVDKTTGESVDQFSIVPLRFRTHHDSEYPVEDRSGVEVGRNGRFRINSGRRVRQPGIRHGFKIEAIDYQPYFSGAEAVVGRQVIELIPEPWSQIEVLDRNGKPVPGCPIRIFSESARMTINGYKNNEQNERHVIKTDDSGKAKVPVSQKPFSLIVFNSTGYAEVQMEPGESGKTIQLQEWAILEGQLSDVGGKNQDQKIIFEGTRRGHGPVTIVQDLTFTNVDESGKFRFDRVPPILGQLRTLGRNEKREEFNNYSMPVKLEAGKTTTVKVGFGVTVSGTLVLSGTDADHELTHTVFMPIAPPKHGLPEGVAELNEFDWRGGWGAYQEFCNSDYQIMPIVYMNSTPICSAKVDNQGRFRINLSEPCEYDLSTTFYANVPKAEGLISGPAASLLKRFEISEADIANGKLDLGTLRVSVAEPIVAGADVTDIAFNVNGVEKKLSAFRSKYVLLDFWRADCAVCKKHKSILEGLAKELDDQSFQIVSLTFEGMASRERSDKDSNNWISGEVLHTDMRQALNELRIWSMPRFVLIDSEGKFVLQGDFEAVQGKLIEIFGK